MWALTTLSILLNIPTADAATINSSLSASKNTSGLIGYWPFGARDVAGVTAYDRSGQGNNGTLTSGPVTSLGKIGQAVTFDGTDDYVSIPDSALWTFNAATEQRTVTAWVKITNFPVSQGYTVWRGLPSGHHYSFSLNSSAGGTKTMGFYDSSSTFASPATAINTNQWYFFTWVVNAGTFTAYKDAELVGSVGSIPSDSNNPTSVAIGGENTAANFLEGIIDEVRIYNRALSDLEIRNLYSSSLAVSQKNQTSSKKNTSTDGLVGYWPFGSQDIVGVTAYDRSGSGLNGTLTNGVLRALGKIGQAMKFDGADDFVTMGNVLDFERTDSFSISAWVKTAETDPVNNMKIVSKRDAASPFKGYALEIRGGDPGNPYRLALTNTNSTNDLRITFGASSDTGWHHVVATYDGGSSIASVRGYIDGVAQATSSTANTLTASITNTFPLNIGATEDSASNVFLGNIDEVRIYNRVLSDQEVRNLYNAGTVKAQTSQATKSTNGLLGYWSFNGTDTAGVTAYDRSSNSNNGTLTNDPTKVVGKLGQALQFNGSSAYVTMGDVAAVDTATSLSACTWVKPASTDTDDSIIAKTNGAAFDDGFILFRDDVGAVSGRTDIYVIYIAESTGTGNARVESVTNASLLNTWTHVCFTYRENNATGLRLYINGVEDTNSPVSTSGVIGIDTGANNLNIGDSSALNRPHDGSIDEVRLYNRVLSAQEIKNLYNLGR